MTSAPRTRTSYMAYREGEEPDEDDPLLSFKPAPHVQLRRNSIGPERQRAFIAHLAACGIVTQAAKHIGASLEALYKLRHKPGAEEFAAAWDTAVDRGITRIQDGALQRAIEGTLKPIVSGGKLLGWYRVHNEGLVTILLRQRRPQHTMRWRRSSRSSPDTALREDQAGGARRVPERQAGSVRFDRQAHRRHAQAAAGE